jgi:hypothetical protein
VDYVIDGAYRVKKQFACVNGWPATIVQCHYGYASVVEVDTKAILQSKFPETGTPNYVTLYTVTSSGADWVLQLRMARPLFEQYFEKRPLSIAINPALAMKIKMVSQASIGQPLQG